MNNKLMRENSQKKLPIFLQFTGYFLRVTPDFPLKLRIRRIVRNNIQDKGYTTCISFDHGERILLNLDDYISQELFFNGIYSMESDLIRLFHSILQEGMIVLDIGAHIGYYTLQTAVRVGCRGEVHAFEPVSNTFAYLKKNILLNKFTNVFLNRYIVHDHCGRGKIFVNDDRNTGKASMVNESGDIAPKVEVVECITIDEYIHQKGLSKIDIVKIDVEGNELSVLKGMKQLFATQNHLIIIIEIHRKHLFLQGIDPQEIYNLLQKFGFSAKRVTTEKSIVLFNNKKS
jgi:FkbM family methyltransferase